MSASGEEIVAVLLIHLFEEVVQRKLRIKLHLDLRGKLISPAARFKGKFAVLPADQPSQGVVDISHGVREFAASIAGHGAADFRNSGKEERETHELLPRRR
jgi:hypothetical protein